MTFTEEKTAIETRLAAAFVAAALVDPLMVQMDTGRNESKDEPSADGHYLRGYKRRTGRQRLGLGEGLDRYDGMVFVQILIPEQEGDSLVEPVYEAIAPSFVTSVADDLEFEEAPDLIEGAGDGTHSVAVAQFPYRFLRPRG